jgi:hypothetical protein
MNYSFSRVVLFRQRPYDLPISYPQIPIREQTVPCIASMYAAINVSRERERET